MVCGWVRRGLNSKSATLAAVALSIVWMLNAAGDDSGSDTNEVSSVINSNLAKV